MTKATNTSKRTNKKNAALLSAAPVETVDAVSTSDIELIDGAIELLEAANADMQPLIETAPVDTSMTFIEALPESETAPVETAPVSNRFDVATLKGIFNRYDAGSRTKQMRALASERSIETALAAGFMTDAIFDGFKRHASLPTGKVAMMQFAKAIDFIASGDPKSIDTACAAFCIVSFLLNESKDITFEDARFTLSSKGNETSKPINGINAQALRQSVGKINNKSTVSAQTSRCVGKNGLLGIIGATEKTGKHTFKVNPGAASNAFIQAYCKALSKLPEGTLLAALNKGEEE
jgi:hypothetical protein